GELATCADKAALQQQGQLLNTMLAPFVGVPAPGVTAGGAMNFAPDRQTELPPEVALAYNKVATKAPPKPAVFESRWTSWGSAFGGGARLRGDAVVGSNDLTTGVFGIAAGADYRLAPDTVLGFALAGGGTNWSLAQNLGSGRSDVFQGGAYGTTRFGPAYLATALAFSNHWLSTNRVALGDPLSARFDGQAYGGRAEAGYRYAVMPAVGLTPYAAVQAQAFHTNSYAETDLITGGFGLTFGSRTATDTRA